MKTSLLGKAIRVLSFIVLLYLVLYYGRPFLVPIAFASILAMLLLPLCLKLERRGVNRGVAILMAELVLVLFFAGVGTLLAWQVSNMRKDADKIEQNVSQKVQQVRQWVSTTFGMSQQKQKEVIQEQQQSGGGQMSGMITGAFSSLGTFLTNTLIVLVYIFLFLYFRPHLRKFVLKLVPDGEEGKAVHIIEDAWRVAQKYITGLALMIAGLWVMYSIGFTIAGVQNSIFFAILCGLLEIVPFVGNITGTLLTVVMAIAQGGSMNVVVGVLITYAVVQFVQTYLMEPLVVGKEVSLNPVFTIIGIIFFEFVWGIPGMILALPILGVVKIVCDNIEPLKPYGFLLGEEKKPKKEGGWMDKLRQKMRSVKK